MMENIPTLKDLAKKIGVSTTTISKALNNHPDISEKRKKEILELVDEMNYVPNTIAMNLRKQKTSFVGLIISDNTNPYFASFIKSVEEQLSHYNHYTLIFNSNEDPKRELWFINELRRMHVAGVIITPALGNRESVALLKKFKIPFVIANRYIKKNEDNYVVADDEEAGYLATNFILKNRKEREIFFLGPSITISTAKERYLGYKKAFNDNGFIFDNSFMYTGVITQEDGYNTAREILEKHNFPFSIVCYSDYIATGVYKAIYEANKNIPNDVAVVGIDNTELFSFTHPGLTTVDIPKKEIGRQSAELLIEIINNKANDIEIIEKQIVLKAELVIRESI